MADVLDDGIQKVAQGRITSFEDLEVWKVSQDWAVNIYEATNVFPEDEKFGITSQIRRAVSSVSANIAEGFGRRTAKDKLHFYTIAYGSALETKNFLHLSYKLTYLNSEKLEYLLEQGLSVRKLINAFTRPLR